MKTILQVCSVSEVKPGEQWVHLIASGISKGYDGRGPYNLQDPEAIIAASLREKTDLVIDRDHATDLLPKGSEVRAAGWIKELQSREDGLWGRVEWTERAEAELVSKEYRYLSPVFMHTKDGIIKKLVRASLTNSPNLELTALASVENNFLNQTEEDSPMNKTLLAIATMLGLAPTATETEIETAATAHVEKTKGLEKDIASIKSALGQKEDAKTADVITTASSLLTTKDVDASKYVPIEDFKQLQTSLASLQATAQNEKVQKAVDAAIKDGKVSPGQKEWATSYASQNLEGFQEFVAKAPAIIMPGAKDGPANVRAENGLSQEEMSVCSALGLTAEQFTGKKEQAL